MLDYDVCTKAESLNEVKPFRVKEVYAEEKLSFPVKEKILKAMVPGILEDRGTIDDSEDYQVCPDPARR